MSLIDKNDNTLTESVPLTSSKFYEEESKAITLYNRGEYNSAQLIFDELRKTVTDDVNRHNCFFNVASCLAASGDFGKALNIMSEINIMSNDLLYNKAVCQYKLYNYDEALHCVDQLLDNCHKMFPELLIESNAEDTEDPEFFEKLKESCLIEGLNLKSAVMFKLNRNFTESKQCLDEVPIKNQELFDCVTLHNQAIYEHELCLDSSIDKLNYLYKLTMSHQEFLVPEETFCNLLILFVKSCRKETAIEFMRLNKTKIVNNLSGYLFQFLEIQLEGHSSPDELLYRKLDKLLDQLLERMKQYDLRSDFNRNVLVTATQERNKLTEFAMTVVTHQGSILWDNNQYHALERLLNKVNFKESSLWKKNMAHTLFMQDTKFDKCSQLYEEFLPRSASESLLEVDPVIIGNLCVAYVLTGRNNNAEALIKDVEVDEIKFANINEVDTLSIARQSLLNDSQQLTEDLRYTSYLDKPKQSLSHLCIINLIIGTLYCVKYNYEFGLTRIFKTLDPIKHKLHTQAWFHVKRCILSLLDSHCKQMICTRDDLFDQVVSFLIQCEKHGVLVETIGAEMLYNLTGQDIALFHGRNSVTYEARYLRSIILTVIHD